MTSKPVDDLPRQIIYIDLRQGDKRQRRSGRLTDELRRMDDSGSAIAERLANSMVKGIRRYREERRSEADSKDLGISKIPLHVTRGMVTSLEELDGIADDVDRALPARDLRSKLAQRFDS